MKSLQLLLIIIGFSMFQNPLKADYYSGSSLYWECIPAGQPDAGKFIFYLRLYRDCYDINGGSNCMPGFLNTIYTSSPAGSIQVYLMSGYPKDVSPQCNPDSSLNHLFCGQSSYLIQGDGGVSEFLYKSNPIQLNGIPPADGWSFSYTSCCRVPSQNIGNNNGYMTKSKMYPLYNNNSYPCYASSPVMAESPTLHFNTGVKYDQYLNWKGINVDSMRYALVSAKDYQGFPVTYLNNFSAMSPFPGLAQDSVNIPLSINSKEGILTFKSMDTGVYFLDYTVSGYLAGVKISEVSTELVYFFKNNTQQSQPPCVSINGSQTESLFLDTFVYVGDSLYFQLYFMDFDSSYNMNERVRFRPFKGMFGAYIPQGGGSLSTTIGSGTPPFASLSPVSNPNSVTWGSQLSATFFSWKPECIHLKYNSQTNSMTSNDYKFVIYISDDYCPNPSVRYFPINVKVKPPVLASPVLSSVVNFQPQNTDMLNWNQVSDAHSLFYSYDIYRSSNIGNGFELVDSVLDFNQNWTIVPNANDTIYHYYMVTRFHQCNNLVSSEPSDTLINIHVSTNPEKYPKTFELLSAIPNPAQESTQIRVFSAQPQPLNFKLYNLTGKLMLDQNWQSTSGLNKYSLDLSSLSSGIYYFKVTGQEGASGVQRLVVME